MKPPPLTPECPRGHPPGSSTDRRVVAIGLVLVGLPFLLGAAGSIIFIKAAIGPAITLGVWLLVLIASLVSASREQRSFSWVECLPVIGCLVVLQLLLDLHTPHLGDIIIAALHALLLLIALVAR